VDADHSPLAFIAQAKNGFLPSALSGAIVPVCPGKTGKTGKICELQLPMAVPTMKGGSRQGEE
jgi:hypothetical protein